MNATTYRPLGQALTRPAVVRSGQEVTAEVLALIGAHRVRLHVCSNAYRDQCHARAHVCHTGSLTWNLLGELPTGAMATRPGLYAVRTVSAAEFSADLAALARFAVDTLTD